MSTRISKKYNTYRRFDGHVLGWERGQVGEGHQATLIEADGTITSFRWRSPKDPIAGDDVTIVLPEKGVSAKPDRPIILLNHTTGDTHVEVNAHTAKSTRRVMLEVGLWAVIASASGALLMHYGTDIQAQIILLVTAALIIFRLAIATRQLNDFERAARRRADEEEVRSETVLSAWKSNAESRRPRIKIEFDETGRPIADRAEIKPSAA
ncbi:hypothetical protein [Croceicoccus gelatinilyticus]|uniref:hypothetical protein n=1 Tax=Croceicoccus gelatinilyticus TaxID=2835536 RepID=UPI001BCD93B0|nr:hypothetical protein [Croceicoccus gelatinilyticus]MBS7671547.1 hypothetical protein [Croceicoccus gelatinilyticus]